jgi:MFS family permease
MWKGRSGFKAATLLVASTLTVMAGAIVAPALPEISRNFLHIPDAELLTRLILTLPALVIALLAPAAGYLVDRWGRKKVLMASLLLYAVSGTTGAYLSNIYHILLGRVFLGVAVGGLMTAVITLIGDYYEGEARNRFMGYQAAFAGAGGLIFITTGGVLADVHWRYPFLIYGASLFVLFMAWVSVKEPVRILEHAAPEADGVKKTTISMEVWLVLAIAFFSMGVFYMVPVQMPFLLNQMEGITNTQIGLAISFMNVSAVATSLNYARIIKRLNFLLVVALVFFLIFVGYLIISQSESYGAMIVGILVCGLGFGMLMANINLWLVTIAPAPLRGRLVGYLNAAIFLGMFLSPVLLHPVIQLTSLQGSFLVVAVLLAFCALVFSVAGLKGRR